MRHKTLEELFEEGKKLERRLVPVLMIATFLTTVMVVAALVVHALRT